MDLTTLPATSAVTDRYALYNGDCIEGMMRLPGGKVGFSIYSPPFASEKGGVYAYSSDPRDLSNSDGYQDALDHYALVVREIHRVTMPGRLTAVHCTDIAMSNTGRDALIDYPGDIIRVHEREGFEFVARHTIWKEPLWVRNRLLLKSLAHRTIVDDSAYAGVASADYLLVFRKRGENAVPIAHPTGFDRYAGECPIPSELQKFKNFEGDQKQNRYSHWIWRRYASSIWDDIDMGRVLPYQDCKEPDDEKHVHPLQLDVYERAIMLRSNPGEIVLEPFSGVASGAFVAVQLGRKAIGFELKPAYYRQGLANMAKVDEQLLVPYTAPLFEDEDWVESE